MANCRYKKILQFYLDGSRNNGHDFKEIEDHLKACLECQVQLAELAGLNSAALEIIDEAPEKEYWESFRVRVRNRITARDIEPVAVAERRRAPWYSSLRLASVLVALVFIVGYSILILQRGFSVLDRAVPTAQRPPMIGEQVVAPPPASDRGQEANPQAGRAESPMVPLTREADGAAQPEKGKNVEPIQGRIGVGVTVDNVEIRDLAGQLRIIGQAQMVGPTLTTEIRSYTPIFASYLTDIDPSFHMKDSFVSQRLLADLNQRPRNGLTGAYPGLMYGFGVPALDGGKISPTNETQSFYGYTSFSSDTSNTAEIRQYFLELELMETK